MNASSHFLLPSLVVPLAIAVHATELAVEPFEGVMGTPIAEAGSGTGWNGPWTGGTILTFDSGLSFVTKGMDSTGLVTSSGKSLKAGGSMAGQDNAPRRMLASSHTVGDDVEAGELPEAYLSFIYQNSGPVAPGHEFRVALTNETLVVASFGKEINGQWRLRTGDQNVNATTNYIGNFFCVVHLAYNPDNGQSTITAYRAQDTDPDIDLTDLTTFPVSVSLSTPGKLDFNSVQIFTHNTTSAHFDEIRIGTDLSNVSATPDPLLLVDDPANFVTDNAPAFTDVVISNAGASNDLVITAAHFAGPDAAAFSIDPAELPITIFPGGSDIIPIDFDPYPAYQASYTATLEVASNDSLSPKTLTLVVANNPDPQIQTAATVSFENNGAADTYTIPVSNTGISQALNISNVSISGFDASTVTGLTFPEILNPAQSGDIDFTFIQNDGLGPYNFTLTVASDDLATPSMNIDVTINVAEPVISVTPGILDFGLLAHKPAPLELPVTISNSAGTLDLNIDASTAITGDTAFSIVSPSLPLAIKPGESIDVTVRFDPGTSGGRFSATLTIDSDDVNSTVPSIPLESFVDPAGTIVARFDFDPNQSFGTLLDVDGSSGAYWTTSDLTDQASVGDRNFRTGLTGNYLSFAARRENAAHTPVAEGDGNQSTWSRFSITPDSGGAVDFTGGVAVIDTYAFSGLGGTTSANWTLYYSIDGGTNWTVLGEAQQGAAQLGTGSTGPVGLSWDLTPVGSQSAAVDFILDPSTIGYGVNGVFNQRDVGYDNLVISASSVTPGIGGGNSFATWAAGFGIPDDPGYDGTDNDGIPALVEYALGLSPHTADRSPGTFDGNTISFTKGGDAVANGDVTYAIETSPDLVDWTTATPDINDATTISFSLPAGQGTLFARLVVSQK